MEDANIILRAYIDGGEAKKQHSNDDYYDENLLLVYDTECQVSQWQELLVGYMCVWENNEVYERALFHGNLKNKEYKILKTYAKRHNIPLITKDELSSKLMYYTHRRRSVICNINLPFDVSMVALSENASKRDRDAFSFTMTDKSTDPRIFIRHRDSKRSFINLVPPYFRNRKKKSKYKGTFVDLRTLAFALTNKSHSLESICEEFEIPNRKLKVEKHGKITPKYISYCINDVDLAKSAYDALLKKVREYDIPLQPSKLSSPASIGKAYFESMGIRPFLEQNPDFSKELLGYVMCTLSAGRTEIKIRKKNIPVSYCDAVSMYPTQLRLQAGADGLGLWKYIIADKIEAKEDKDFQEFLDKITLEDLRNKETWNKLQGIALIQTNGDYLPVRSKFGNKISHNMGMAYVSGGQLWYTYADIIASRIKINKSARVIKAYKFEAVGLQPTLRPTRLFGKVVDPRSTNFIQLLIEHRMEVKEKLKSDPNNIQLQTEEHESKIQANALSFGVYIEISAKSEPANVTVYGLDSFNAKVNKKERFGKAFNPMISTWLTSGARLFLAMAEVFLERNGGYYVAACDTDSIFIEPKGVKPLQEYFSSLNPYSKNVEVFKVEKLKDGTMLHDVMFYGISAKRYCLYKEEGNKITILKHSSHALGGITGMPKGWEKGFWEDIIKYDKGIVKDDYIESKYGNYVVAGKLAITSPALLRYFNKLNNAKHRMKAFNFVIAGVGFRLNPKTKEPIIPIVPFTKDDADSIRYMPFIDKKTGKLYTENTEYYWKPMSKLFFEYINHRESKFDGDIGTLQNKHINIVGADYIGKESNNLERAEVTGIEDDDYVYYRKDLKDKIVKRLETFTKDEAKSHGMSTWQYNYIQRCLKGGKMPKFKKKTLKLLGLL